MDLTDAVIVSSEYLLLRLSFIKLLQGWESTIFEPNWITFRSKKSGTVASLGFKNFMIKLISYTVGLQKSEGLLNFPSMWLYLDNSCNIEWYLASSIYHRLDLMDFLWILGVDPEDFSTIVI